MRKGIEIGGLFVLILLLGISVSYGTGILFGQSSKQTQWIAFGAVILFGVMFIALSWDLYLLFSSRSTPPESKQRLEEFSKEGRKLRSKDDHPNNAALN